MPGEGASPAVPGPSPVPSASPREAVPHMDWMKRRRPATWRRLTSRRSSTPRTLHLVVALGVPLEPLEVLHGDQRVAVDPDEAVAELLLELPQGVVDEKLAARVSHRDVLLIGLEVAHLLDRHQLDPAPRAGADVGAGLALALLLRERGELCAVRARRAGERVLEIPGSHRLQQIADRLHVERLDRVLLERGAEDHRRRGLELRQVSGGLQAVHAGHANVHQHDVRHVLLGEADRLHAVGGLPGEIVAVQTLDEPSQAIARQLFVVDDQDLHGCPCSSDVCDERLGATACGCPPPRATG